ncbi:MAG: MATE family efflux transporter [Spirochaetaceae bacterium]|nr:MATE family efflux transporter [Spirochaetaceae bacterium]
MPLDRKTLLVGILPLTLPILAEQALIVGMSTVNGAMASNVGKVAASSIGIVDAITWVLIGFFTSLALGGTVLVAQCWGRNDREAARRAAAQTIMACVALATVLGALAAVFARDIIAVLYPGAEPAVVRGAAVYLRITALGYPFLAATLASSGVLRGAGDSRSPMFVNVSMSVVNVAASAFLIFGLDVFGIRTPAFGVAGAAMGITLARAFGTAFYAYVFRRGSLVLRLESLSAFRPDAATLGKVFSIGIPSGIETLTFNGGKLLTQVYIVSLGTGAIAANYVASSISGFLQIPGASLSIAATTLVGQAVGKRDYEGAKRLLLGSVVVGSLSQLALTIPGFPLTAPLIGLYTADAEVARIAGDLLKIMFIASPLLWSTSFILPAGLRGAGDVRFPMFVSMASMWSIRVSFGWVLAIPLGLGVVGVWAAMIIDWVLRSAFFGLRLHGHRWRRDEIKL